MKKLILAPAFALFFTASLALACGSVEVEGMTCSGCANSITAALKKFPEVENVKVDVESGKVNLHFKEGKSLSEDVIRKAIEGSGYKVKKFADHTAPKKS